MALTSAFVVAFAALLGNAHAFWRMNCANIQLGRVDPIVNPGKVSAHVHTVQGGANFGINATGASLASSDCTSCEIQDDKSAYWTALLYYQFANGSFIDVKQSGSVLYYIGRGTNKTNIVPFPPGFRMVSGDAGVRSYDNTTLTYKNTRPIADRISWACLSTTPSKETPGINSTDCYAGLRAQLHFQSCWNGVDLYKSDNSHVAYMSQIDNGDCPPTHPYQLVHVFIETSYQVNSVPKEPGGRFVLSTGDPTGYSFHGDFQNGWNQTTLQRALAKCASNPNSSGDINECDVLVESYTKNYNSRCPTRNSTVQEQVTGLLPKLPGCINVVNGPARAQASDMNCPTSVIPPAVLATPDSTPLPIAIPQRGQPFGLTGWNYIGCSNDTLNGARVLGAITYSSTANMTVEVCQSYCAGKGYKYAGLEIGSQCYCDNYMLNNPVISNGSLTQGMCYYQCSGNELEYCGGQARLDIYNNLAVAQLPLPTVLKSVGTYSSKGCYTEAKNGLRTLSNASTSSDTMTPDVCRKFCLGKKFKWFGVEYGRECYCGDRLNSNATKASDSDCSMLCSGNAGQTQAYCGGSSRLNTYFSSTL